MTTSTSNAVVALSTPSLEGREREYLNQAIDSTWVSSDGPFVTRFEEDVARCIGARHAVAMVNGTAALHMALVVGGVTRDDFVLMPPLTFIASANAVKYCGADPVFVDVEEESWNLDPGKVERFCREECRVEDGRVIERASGRRVAAIMMVDVLGHPANADPLMEIARRYGLWLVEDACEALGSRYGGRAAGRLGSVGAFSFNGNKIVTAGGAGMVVTDNEAVARRARHLSRQARQAGPEYIHDAIGYNYRLTNVCAAVGVAQMELLDQFLKRKLVIARRYREAFAEMPGVVCMPEAPWAESNQWLFSILLPEDRRDGPTHLVEYLSRAGIEARRLWRPLHMLSSYASDRCDGVPIAEALYRHAVSLPSSVHLSEPDQHRVIDAVRTFLGSGEL